VSTLQGNSELALHVADPASAVAFYTNVLGCTEISRSPDRIEVTSGALRLFLLRDPAPTHDGRPVVRRSGLRTLGAAGWTLVPIGPHSPDGVYLRDPHGVLFDVIERRLDG
jgi:hypothetical protein